MTPDTWRPFAHAPEYTKLLEIGGWHDTVIIYRVADPATAQVREVAFVRAEYTRSSKTRITPNSDQSSHYTWRPTAEAAVYRALKGRPGYSAEIIFDTYRGGHQVRMYDPHGHDVGFHVDTVTGRIRALLLEMATRLFGDK